jgi:hypothetical protein
MICALIDILPDHVAFLSQTLIFIMVFGKKREGVPENAWIVIVVNFEAFAAYW